MKITKSASKTPKKIERKNLNFRAWIKRVTRKTICCSTPEKMHDIVVGLLINKVEFGAAFVFIELEHPVPFVVK
ncbi:MAG: hypothetical protein GXP08_06615 [Gammaproteobacteria bacterium]|nr:hypothetical protein [Gammaproteobacteria bacterium]